jgi:6-phosphofructokinase 1
MSLKGKALIAQSGGPTHVINNSFVGAALEARKYSNVTKVYGALNGVEGIVNEDFLDLSSATINNLNEVADTPSSGLLSTRVKPDAAFCEKVVEVLKAHDIRFVFYIGGNDSSDTIRIVKEFADKEGYEMQAVHIPKTIDNDLVINDHTPGFGSAARFVASAFAGVNLDNRALPGVYIGVVMGRHAGFLTGASVLGKKYPDDGPHLVYVPERDFDSEKFVQDVKDVYAEHGRCIVAVSEGIQDADGTPIVSKLQETVEKDAHGNVQLSGTGALGDLLADLVKNNTDIDRVRTDTFGYLQRSFVGAASDVDQKEAREVAERAVQFALNDNKSGSVVIKRIADYGVNYELVNLSDVAAKTKHMADEYINAAGNNVTKAFVEYAKPLIGSDFPTIARVQAPMVEKIINK